MDGDEIHLVHQIRVFQPDMPGFGYAHRSPHLFLDPPDVVDGLLERDLLAEQGLVADNDPHDVLVILAVHLGQPGDLPFIVFPVIHRRSEERRVGKECRSRWSPYH